jgi:hypothetical protein
MARADTESSTNTVLTGTGGYPQFGRSLAISRSLGDSAKKIDHREIQASFLLLSIWLKGAIGVARGLPGSDTEHIKVTATQTAETERWTQIKAESA